LKNTSYKYDKIIAQEESLLVSSRKLQTLSCNTAIGFIQYNNICLNCRNIKYTAGPSAQNISSCGCQTNAAWNSSANVCSCYNIAVGLYTALYKDSCIPCANFLYTATLINQCNAGTPTVFPYNSNY
jgi:hypothetical protein